MKYYSDYISDYTITSSTSSASESSTLFTVNIAGTEYQIPFHSGSSNTATGTITTGTGTLITATPRTYSSPYETYTLTYDFNPSMFFKEFEENENGIPFSLIKEINDELNA